MFTAKIIDIKKDVYQFSQEPFLDVTVEILDQESVIVETRKYAYDIEVNEETIKSDVAKMLENYVFEKEELERQKISIEKNAVADSTIEALKGAEITMPE